MSGETLLLALGLVFVIEGLAYAIFPTLLRRMISSILAQSDDHVRIMGAISIAIGVFVVWAGKTFF